MLLEEDKVFIYEEFLENLRRRRNEIEAAADAPTLCRRLVLEDFAKNFALLDFIGRNFPGCLGGKIATALLRTYNNWNGEDPDVCNAAMQLLDFL